MGGNALKNVKTERKNVKDYNRIKSEIIQELSKYIFCKVIIEAPQKESYGDLDVLYISNPEIDIRDLIIKLFNPKEIVNMNPIISFDYDNFQIDLIKSMSLEDFNSNMFYFAYGDLGCLMGKMINFYNIKLSNRGLCIDINNTIDDQPLGVNSNIGKEIILSNKPEEICKFFELDYEQWEKGFDSNIEIFNWLVSSKYFIKGIFKIDNRAERIRMEKRKMYIEFFNWLWKDEDNSTEPKPTKIFIQAHAIKYFNKKNELDMIVNESKILEDRKKKYNGKIFIQKGFKDKLIFQKMNEFQKYIENLYKLEFTKWLDDVDSQEVQINLDKFLN
jgi:hypothetical protein